MDVAVSSTLESEHPPGQPDNVIKSDDKKRHTSLPWLQLSIVYLIQFSEPVAGIVIYPFVNQFVRDTGITRGDERRTGYFAGIIESAFFFAEATTVIFWGMASDRFGRRPVLILGPLGLSIAMIGFGTSTSFWYLVAFRCFQGVFNGNIGVSKSVIGELTDETNIGDAMAFISVIWSVGTTIAPIIGGLLSHPANRWPDTLGRLAFLKHHPYFLPCFVSSIIAFITFLIALIGFKETLLSRKQKARAPTSSTSLTASSNVPHYGSVNDTNRSDEDAVPELDQNIIPVDDSRPRSLRMIMDREVMSVLLNYAFLTFCDMCITALLPLTWSTSIEHGGLGFSASIIGTTMGAFGVVNAFIQINVLGKVIRRFGARKVFIVCFPSLLLLLACFPLETYFAHRAGRADWRVWTVIVIQLTMEIMKFCAYGSVHILITVCAQSRSTLGTINGIAQALGCTLRSLAPSAASSLYAVSLQRGWAGGNAVFYIVMAVVVCGIRFTWILPKTSRLR